MSRAALSFQRTVLLVALTVLAAGCNVNGVDTKREGFPCNADGSCRNGLVCYQDKCVLPAHVPSDGGAKDAGVDAGTPDAGTPDAGTPDGGSCETTGANACAGCSDGTACSAGTSAGVCHGGLCSPGCLISGVTYATGAHASNDLCHVCDPTVSVTSFATASDGTACTDDGNDCTSDTCSGGVCSHPSVSDGTACTDDGNPCTDDTCANGMCTHPDSASGTPCGGSGQCNGSGACSAGCDIGSNHYNAGDPNPQDGCQLCDPATSSTSWTAKADGVSCADDGNPCTNDMCSGGTCTHPAATGGGSCSTGICDGSGQCQSGCFIGGTFFAASSTNPGNTCETCDPTVSTTGWSPKGAGTACANDGNPCTSDVCSNGACTHPAASTGTACGTGKVCDATATCAADCYIGGTLYGSGTTRSSNVCQVCMPSTSTTSWSNVADNTSCDDGNLCNGVDTCQTGSCTQTTAPVSCTSPPLCHISAGATCDTTTGVCTYPIAADGTSCAGAGPQYCHNGTCSTGCFISGTFYASGTTNPTNYCQSCQPSVSSTSWSNANEAKSCSAPSKFCHNGACDLGCGISGVYYTNGTQNPGNVCQLCDSTNGFGWTNLADNTSCDDGNYCNGVYTCQTGSCTQTTAPVVCNNPPACHTTTAATCNTSTGVCSYPTTASDGTSCGTNSECCTGSCTAFSDPCNCGYCGNTCPPGTPYCSLTGFTCVATCFVAGTPVRLADGRSRPIEKVRVGDMVLADDTRTGLLVPAEVVRTFVHSPEMTKETLVIDGTLRTTPNHPFFANGRWVRADALRVGDVLVSLAPDGGTRKTQVSSIEKAPGGMTTYNLEVAGVHDYFAGGVLVHNKPPMCPY